MKLATSTFPKRKLQKPGGSLITWNLAFKWHDSCVFGWICCSIGVISMLANFFQTLHTSKSCKTEKQWSNRDHYLTNPNTALFYEHHSNLLFCIKFDPPKTGPPPPWITDLGSRMSINGGDVSTSKDVAVTMATWSLQHWVKIGVKYSSPFGEF